MPAILFSWTSDRSTGIGACIFKEIWAGVENSSFCVNVAAALESGGC